MKCTLTVQQDAWDSYIQGPGTTLDTNPNFFPGDFGSIPMQTDNNVMPNDVPTTQPNGAQQQARTNAFGQSVFMGVSLHGMPQMKEDDS